MGHPDVLRKLGSAWRRLRQAHARGDVTPRQVVFEEVEARLLYSADLAPGISEVSVGAEVRQMTLVHDEPSSQTQGQEAEQRTEIIFIDSSVARSEQLVQGILAQNPQAEIITLEADEDGIARITDVLAGRSNISALHLITHGRAGVLQLGSTQLDSNSLGAHEAAVRSWQEALSSNADLLLYGCDLASTDAGRDLVNALGYLSGADVAASDDLTGSAALGGDWVLEYRQGAIESAVVISAAGQENWMGTLAVVQDSVSTAATSGAGATNLSFAHTVGTGTNGILIVEYATRGNTSPDSITFNGVALTRLDTVSNGTIVTSEIWYLKTPTSGTHNIVVTLSGAAKEFAVGATSYFNVDQSTTFGTVAKATGNSSAVSTNVASSTGDLVIDSIATRQQTATPTAGLGQTGRWTNDCGTSSADPQGAGSSAVGAPSVTMSWSLSSAQEWAALGVSLKSAFASVVNEDSTLVFSSAGGNPLTVSDGSAANGILSAQISVTQGIFTLSQTTGLVFLSGANGTGAMTVQGTESAINAALDGASFTPTNNYNGPANIQIYCPLPAVSDMAARYQFGSAATLGQDATGNYNASVVSNVSVVNDATYGSVASLTGADNSYIMVNGLYGNPASFTLSGRVNLPASGGWFGKEMISLGDTAVIRLDRAAGGTGVTGIINTDSGGWQFVQSGTSIAGTGWHDLALTFDNATKTGVLYIDGVAVYTTTLTGSPSYTLGSNSFLGRHGNSVDGYGLSGMMDDVRIFTRALNASEINQVITQRNVSTLNVGITVNPVNDAPVITTTGSTLSYTENAAATAVDSGLTLTDADTTNMTGATVQITGNYSSSQDVLAFTNQLGITGSWNSTTGTLTLSGTTTVANYQTALRAVTYANSSDNPSTSTRTVTFTLNDGSTTGSNTRNISVTAVNDAPVNTVPGVQSIDEDMVLVFSSANGNQLQIGDVDAASGNLQVTLAVTHGTLTLATTSGLSFTTGDGTSDASMVFTGTLASINTALATLTYIPTANFNGSATLSLTTSDQGNTGSSGPQSDTDTVTINVMAVIDEPVVTVPGSQSINEDSNLAISGISVHDVDGSSFAVVLSVSNGTLNVTLSGAASITAGSNGSATLTLSGSETDINATLASLIYRGNLNFNGSDTLTVISKTGEALPTLVSQYHFESAGALTLDSQGNFSTGLASNVSVLTDPTHGKVASLTGADNSYQRIDGLFGSPASFTLSGWVNLAVAGSNGSEMISLGDSVGIRLDRVLLGTGVSGFIYSTNGPSWQSLTSGVNIAGTGWRNVAFTFDDSTKAAVIYIDGYAVASSTLTGSVSYTLGTNTFLGRHGNGANGWGLNGQMDDVRIYARALDASEISRLATPDTYATVGITVNPINDAPVVTASGTTLSYAENAAATVVDSALTISDVDSTNLSGATIQITGNYQSGQDVLAFSNQLGITGSWDSGTGTLTLSGTTTVANYQTALRTVTYQNTSDNPNTSNRTVSFTVSDGSLSSNTATRDISVANANDAPVVTIAQPAYSATEQVSLSLAGTGLSLADVDAASGSLSATLSVVSGTLTVAAGSTGVGVGGSGTNTVTLTGTLAQINNLLAGNGSATISYLISSDTPPATDTLTLAVNDNGNTGGGNLSDSDSVAINIAAVNDAPVVTVPGGQSVAEDAALAFTGGATISVNDVDGNLGTVQLSVGDGALTVSLAGGASISSGSNGSATLTLSGTQTQINAALATLSYQGNANFNGSDTLTVLATDAGGGTDTDTVAITVNAVNDAPINTVPGAQSTNEDTALVFSSANGNQLQIGDVDAASGNLQVTLAVTHGTLTLATTSGLSFTTGDGTSDASMVFTGTLASINTALATLTYMPTADFSGSATLSLTTDDQGNTGTGGALSDSKTVTITVTSLNDAPTVANSIPDQNATEGAAFSFQFSSTTFNDVDVGGTLSYTTSSLPAWLSFDALTRTFSGTPANADVGSTSITVTATDGNGASISDSFTLTVINTNDAPTLDVNNGATLAEGASVTLSAGMLSASDNDNSAAQIIYTLNSLPAHGQLSLGGNALTAGSSFTQADILAGQLIYTHDGSEGGADGFSFSLSDSNGGNGGTASFAITITPVNDNAPIITSHGSAATATISLAENSSIATTVTASDADLPAQTLTYSIVGGLDASLFNIDAATGVLSFATAPNFEAPIDSDGDNQYLVVVQASDGSLTDTQTLLIQVSDANESAIGPISDTDAAANVVMEGAANGSTTGIVAQASDTDGSNNTISYSLDDDAGGRFTIDASSGVVRVANGSLLDHETTTSHDIAIRASSSDGSFRTQLFSIALQPVNDNAPIITSNGGGASTNVSLQEGQPGVTTVTASDADLPAQNISYSIIGGSDAGLFVIDANTGTLRFLAAPDFENPLDADRDNVYQVIVQASDGAGQADTQLVAITVINVNEAPLVQAPTSAVISSYSAVPILGVNVMDVDGNVVSVHLRVDHGQLHVHTTPGVSISSGSNGSSALTLSGNQVALNAALASLAFSGTPSENGIATLNLSAVDSNGLTHLAQTRLNLSIEDTATPQPNLQPEPTLVPTPDSESKSEPYPKSDTESPSNTELRSDLDADLPLLPKEGTSTESSAGSVLSSIDAPLQPDAHSKRSSTAPDELRLGGSLNALPDLVTPEIRIQLSRVTLDPGRVEYIRNQNTELSVDWGSISRTTNAENDLHNLTPTQAGTVATVAMTAGVVWWAGRSAGLITALMASVPAWRTIDPLPILARDRQRSSLEDEQTDDDQLDKSRLPRPGALEPLHHAPDRPLMMDLDA